MVQQTAHHGSKSLWKSQVTHFTETWKQKEKGSRTRYILPEQPAPSSFPPSPTLLPVTYFLHLGPIS
jgi:hypothetical protein